MFIEKTLKNIVIIIASWISNYEINYRFLFKEIEMHDLITRKYPKFWSINNYNQFFHLSAAANKDSVL